MARIRTIKPEFPQSESMGRVSRDARLAFIMLWTIADDAGRLRGNSRMLASLLFPYDDDARKLIDKWLVELEAEGCVTRYAVGADSYVQINGWSLHQKIDKPSASKIPAPPESSRILANPRESSPLDQGEDQGREGKGEEPKAASVPDAPPPLKQKKKTRLPDDFALSERVKAWAKTKGFGDLEAHLEVFRDKAVAKGYTYEDWDLALMNAIREDWAKLRSGRTYAPLTVTVPSAPGRDPALIKLDEDAKKAAPIPPAIKAHLERLRGSVLQ